MEHSSGTMMPPESLGLGQYNESHSSCPVGQSITSHPSATSQPLNDGGVQITGNVEANKTGTRKRSKLSKAWDHFIVEEDKNDGKEYGRCKHCKVVRYENNSKLGTSNFLRHLEKCSEYLKVNQTESSTTSKQIDRKVFHELLAETIMRHGLPFKFVENEAVRKLFKYLNDNVDTITRNTVKKICSEKHQELKWKIKDVLKKLPGRISLTCDTWTSGSGRGYLCVTAHYIDETWTLHSKLLCFRHLSPPHGGYELSVEIGSVLYDWGIERKVLCLTADNATNMDKMVKMLKDGTILKDLVCKGKYFHIRCCAHILNLIVRNGLKVIDNSVVKLREGIKYIDGSEARFQKFYDLAKRSSDVSFSGGLWLDVATRWNSTYVMLDRALKYRSVLNLYFEELGADSMKYQLGDDEWERVELICTLLEPFYDITTLFSGSDYPTANLYLPQVFLIRARLRDPIDDFDTPDELRKAIKEMIVKFNKYWSDYAMILSFAVVLDPRYKFKFVEWSFAGTFGWEEGEKKAKEVKLSLEELFKEYQDVVGIGNSTRTRQFRVQTQFQYNNIEEFEYFDQRDISKSELDKYLDDDRLPISKEFDVLNHWRVHSVEYPVLSAMARDILAIPITSVASESTFSMGGRIISKSRSALVDKNIEVLVTTKNWLTGYDDFTLEGASVQDSHLSADGESEKV